MNVHSAFWASQGYTAIPPVWHPKTDRKWVSGTPSWRESSGGTSGGAFSWGCWVLKRRQTKLATWLREHSATKPRTVIFMVDRVVWERHLCSWVGTGYGMLARGWGAWGGRIRWSNPSLVCENLGRCTCGSRTSRSVRKRLSKRQYPARLGGPLR